MYIYKDYALNSLYDDPWYTVEQTAFQTIIDKLPTAASTSVTTQHHHSRLSEPTADTSAIVVAETGMITMPLESNGIVTLAGGDNHVAILTDVTSYVNETAAMVGYTNAAWPSATHVNDALDLIALGIGITGMVGTQNYVPVFTSSTSIGNSTIYDMGISGIGIGTTVPQNALGLNSISATTPVLIQFTDATSGLSDPTSGATVGKDANGDAVVQADYTHSVILQPMSYTGPVGGLEVTVSGIIPAVSTPGHFDSTVVTGTAPIQVSSTTKCTNLNADMVDGYHVSTGSFTATVCGCTGGNPTTTAIWEKHGNIVTLWIPECTGASDTTDLTVTGMPADIMPTSGFRSCGACRVYDGGFQRNAVAIMSKASNILMFVRYDDANFQTSGSKGTDHMSLTYNLLI